MVSRKRSTTKSVTFNQQENDQELLIEIEKILATERFKSFGELCKAALHYYLSSPTANKSNKETSKSEITHQKLSQIQRQIDGFEGTVILEYLEPLKQQISILNQQIQSLEGQGNHPSSSHSSLDSRTSELTSSPHSPLDSRASERNFSPTTTVEDDPILDHLTPLLEDF